LKYSEMVKKLKTNWVAVVVIDIA